MKKVKLFRNIAGAVSDSLGFEPDIALGTSKVTVLGTNELQIENHKGIIECSPEVIRFRSDGGIILIEGAGLLLNVFDSEKAVVSGRIFSFRALGGGKP